MPILLLLAALAVALTLLAALAARRDAAIFDAVPAAVRARERRRAPPDELRPELTDADRPAAGAVAGAPAEASPAAVSIPPIRLSAFGRLDAAAALAGTLRFEAALVAVGGLLLAVAGQALLDQRRPAQDGVVLLLLGAALFARVTRHLRLRAWPTAPAAPLASLLRDRRIQASAALALLANGVALALFARNADPNLAWLAYAVSVASLIVTVGLLGAPRLRVAPGWPVWAGLGLFALAAFFRLYQLGDLPYGVWFDEAAMGNRILRLLRDPSYRPIFDAGVAPDPSLRLYLSAPFVLLFGPTALALRLGSVVAGLLAVLGVFLLARELFGRPTAWTAALLLAVMAWHVNFSRIGLIGIWSVAFDALAAALLLRALRSGRPAAALLGGMALGGGLFMYSTSRLLPFVLALYAGHRLLTEGPPFLRRALPLAGPFVVGAVLVVSPLALYALQRPAEFFARTEQVSIWREIGERGSLDPLWSNLTQHLLMFNVAGDRNGRHNLPGAPMLEPVIGALFVAGLAVALLRVRRPEFFLPLAWAAVMLAGGVFSLAFEAPQGVRTIDEVVAVALLAALPLGLLFQIGATWPRPRAGLLWGVVALALVAAAGSNYHRYFVQHAGDAAAWQAFSTKETIVGRRLAQLPAETAVYLADTFTGHPTVQFLSQRAEAGVRFDPALHLPVPGRQPTVLFLEEFQGALASALLRMHPGAAATQYRPPMGGPVVLHEVQLDAQEVASAQGLLARYRTADGVVVERRAETLDLADPARLGVALPATATWEGALRAPAWGSYALRLEAPPGAQLALDDRATLTVAGAGERSVVVEGTLQLARGNHRLRLIAPLQAGQPVRLAWRPPGGAGFVPVPAESFTAAPLAGAGLLGAYYRNADWRGAPAFTQVDPVLSFRFHTLPLNRPYSVAWSGTLLAPVAGTYRFGTQSIDGSWLYVDGKLVVENGRERDRYVEGAIDLAAGPHDLLVRFQDRTSFTRIDVFWTPPGGERAIIPPEALRPATQPPEPPAALPGPVSALEPLKATEHRLLRRLGGQPALSRPRGVAVAPNGSVYVSDNGNARVVRFGPDGARLGEFGRPGDGEAEFLDPTDLTFDGAGRLVVLDSENAWVRWFDAEGRFLRRAVGPGAGFFHPRALTLDRAGRLVLADTGRSRLVVLDPNGQVLRQIGEKGTGDGQLIEPTGVALDTSGNLYAADPTNGTFIKFSPEGEYQWHIVIPKGVTVVGPHAATAPDGWIYLTDPSRRQVLRIHPDTRAVERVVVLEDGREAPLGEPVGIAVDGAGRVYVADSGLNQVLVFAAR